MTTTLVTIAIPTFRRLDYLKQAVESAQRQTHPALQIIVSDNDSGDGTSTYLDTLATDPRVLVLRQSENLGMVGNWNACLERARGDWFLLLSDDDYLEPEAIATMLATYAQAETPERVGMLYCRTRTVDAEGKPLSIASAGPTQESAYDFALRYFERRRVLFPCSVMLRTEDLRAHGYRAEGIRLGCDAIAWSEVLLRRQADGAHASVVHTAAVLSNYRVHPNNLTSTESVTFWIHDLRVLMQIWEQAFKHQGTATQQRFHRANSSYFSYFLATVLSQGARGPAGTLRALGRLLQHRSIFRGATGKSSLLLGIVRVLLPSRVDRFARAMRTGLQSRGISRSAARWRTE